MRSKIVYRKANVAQAAELRRGSSGHRTDSTQSRVVVNNASGAVVSATDAIGDPADDDGRGSKWFAAAALAHCQRERDGRSYAKRTKCAIIAQAVTEDRNAG